MNRSRRTARRRRRRPSSPALKGGSWDPTYRLRVHRRIPVHALEDLVLVLPVRRVAWYRRRVHARLRPAIFRLLRHLVARQPVPFMAAHVVLLLTLSSAWRLSRLAHGLRLRWHHPRPGPGGWRGATTRSTCPLRRRLFPRHDVDQEIKHIAPRQR